MTDILNISESQARVLRAIAYYEEDSKIKGATQYSCFNKVPNRLPISSSKVPDQLHVSGSTFNDNITYLEENQMVKRLEVKKKKGGRETKPYTITDIGQIAWLRCFPLPENIDIIKKIFPNIQLSEIDKIINEIEHPGIKHIKNNFAVGILKIALDSLHIEDIGLLSIPHMKTAVEEIIELSGFRGRVKTSYARYYSVIKSSLNVELTNEEKRLSGFNFNELKISVIDRVIFLFYYNLIQSVTDMFYLFDPMKIKSPETKLYKIMKDTKFGSFKESHSLPRVIVKKKNEILKLINSNDIVSKIIQDNLKDLSEYKDTDFQNISKLFIKA